MFRVGPVKLFADGSFVPACSGHLHGVPVIAGATMPPLEEQTREVVEREWLRLWRAAADDAGRQVAERGRLRPGLRADFAAIEGHIDDDDDIVVAETWVGGRCVYRRHHDRRLDSDRSGPRRNTGHAG